MHIPQAFAAAFLIPAAAMLLGGWPWRRSRPSWASAVGVLGVALGFLAACPLLDEVSHWPPSDASDRLQLIVLPAVVVVEMAAAFAGRFRWLFWLPRLVVAGGAARVLLDQSSFIADLPGGEANRWTTLQTIEYLGGMAAALVGVWALLALLMRRSSGRSVPLAVTLAAAGAAATVLLSGDATGGLAGLAFAVALVGALAASLLLAPTPDLNGLLGVGVVGLFALVVTGHFFAELTAVNAGLLFFAPLLCWLIEVPPIRRAWPWVRGVVRVSLVLAPVVVALALAQQKSAKDLAPRGSGVPEATNDDYINFGK